MYFMHVTALNFKVGIEDSEQSVTNIYEDCLHCDGLLECNIFTEKVILCRWKCIFLIIMVLVKCHWQYYSNTSMCIFVLLYSTVT